MQALDFASRALGGLTSLTIYNCTVFLFESQKMNNLSGKISYNSCGNFHRRPFAAKVQVGTALILAVLLFVFLQALLLCFCDSASICPYGDRAVSEINQWRVREGDPPGGREARKCMISLKISDVLMKFDDFLIKSMIFPQKFYDLYKKRKIL